MESPITLKRSIQKYAGSSFITEEDEIATEYPLTIVVDGAEFATMVCSPSDLEELVIGFLASEGVIRTVDEIASLSLSMARGFAYVSLHQRQQQALTQHSKRFIGSCCGKSRQFYLHNDMRTAKTVQSRATVSVGQILQLMESLQQSSVDFQSTGGVHNAALCTNEGIIVARTDIGRHNALDKLFGYCLQHKLPLGDKLIAFSGRISSEVLLKAAKIGIGILLSKSAPTDLALSLAEDLGITAVGFIRGSSLNVYTHPHRVIQ